MQRGALCQKNRLVFSLPGCLDIVSGTLFPSFFLQFWESGSREISSFLQMALLVYVTCQNLTPDFVCKV